MYYQLSNVFNFLPSEAIKASELKRGDVVFMYSRWDLIIDSDRQEEHYNNGLNQRLKVLGGGATYLAPDHNVTVIKRDLINSSQMEKFISDYLEEERKREELARQEEEEEIEREKDYLRARLRSLGDD